MQPDFIKHTFYHVTLAENAEDILEQGILPTCSLGKLQANWYVSRQELEWAILHVSARHDVPVSEIVVCEVAIYFNEVKRTKRPGVFYSFKSQTIQLISPAMQYIEVEY
jgi:hypothetical protein